MAGPMQSVSCVRCGEPLTVGLQFICPRCGMPVSASVARAQMEASGADGVLPRRPADREVAAYAPGGVPLDFDQPTAAFPPVTSGYGQGGRPGGLEPLPDLDFPPYGSGPQGYDNPPQFGAPSGTSATLPGYGSALRGAGAPIYGEPNLPQPPTEKRDGSRAGLIAGLVVVALLVFGASVFALVALAGKGAATMGGMPHGTGATLTGTAAALPTATASNAIYASTLKGAVSGWPTSSGCASSADGYHVRADASCFAPTDDLGDFDLHVTAQQVGGDSSSAYGLMFRGDVSSLSTGIDNVYAFFITGKGHWYFFKFLGGQPTLIQQGSSTAISSAGANVLGVRAQGSHFVLSVNGATLTATDDSSIAKGKCGLQGYAGSDIRFTDLSIRGV